jgi:hypothetical protein
VRAAVAAVEEAEEEEEEEEDDAFSLFVVQSINSTVYY